MCDNKFYICEHCGNIVGMIHNAGVPMMCCGQKMTKLEAGVVEASHEKHIPVVTVEGNIVRVNVGSVTHPMSEEHHIAWVYLQTTVADRENVLITPQLPRFPLHCATRHLLLFMLTATCTVCGKRIFNRMEPFLALLREEGGPR